MPLRNLAVRPILACYAPNLRTRCQQGLSRRALCRGLHEQSRDPMTQAPRQVPVFVETGSASGAWMQRIDRHAARGQTTREFFGVQRRRQFRLAVKCEWVIEASTIQIIE